MSWIEVESKVKVYDLKKAREKIRSCAKYVGTQDKIDDYYSMHTDHKYPKKSLRIRKKGKKRIVNFKQRLGFKEGIWAKREVEFEVSDIKNFYYLLNDFGFNKWMRKEKKSETYNTKDNVTIELNYVKKLGWYIEIEVLCKENKEAIDKARKRVMEIMNIIGVKKKSIQKSGYTKVLWQMKQS